MNESTIWAAITGVLASLLTQIIKRDKAGSLENILLTLGTSFGGLQLANLFSPNLEINSLAPIISSFAFHGLAGDQAPMQALKLGGLDKAAESVGKVFTFMSSRSVKPPS